MNKLNAMIDQLRIITLDMIFETREAFEDAITKFLAHSNLKDYAVEFQYPDEKGTARADIAVKFDEDGEFYYIPLEISAVGILPEEII